MYGPCVVDSYGGLIIILGTVELEREIYGRPFTTVRPVPFDIDEEIAALIADLT